MMKSYSLEQRLFFVKTYYRNGESITVTLRKCRTKYGQHFTLARETLRQLIKKFEQTGSLADRAIPGRPRTGRTSHNIAAVRNSVDADPTISTRRRAQQLGLSTSTVHLILKEELHVHSHRAKRQLERKPAGPSLDIEVTTKRSKKPFAKCPKLSEEKNDNKSNAGAEQAKHLETDIEAEKN